MILYLLIRPYIVTILSLMHNDAYTANSYREFNVAVIYTAMYNLFYRLMFLY